MDIHALKQDPGWAVLADLKFVAHDAHFAVEIGARDAGVNHAVGFHFQGEAQILVGGGHGLEVIRAVEERGAVEGGAVRTQLGHDFLALVGAFVEHVLQQVGHAGFTVAFVAGADQVSDVDGNGGLGGIGEQDDVESVIEFIFRDAFDGGDFGLRGGEARARRAAVTRILMNR